MPATAALARPDLRDLVCSSADTASVAAMAAAVCPWVCPTSVVRCFADEARANVLVALCRDGVAARCGEGNAASERHRDASGAGGAAKWFWVTTRTRVADAAAGQPPNTDAPAAVGVCLSPADGSLPDADGFSLRFAQRALGFEDSKERATFAPSAEGVPPVALERVDVPTGPGGWPTWVATAVGASLAAWPRGDASSNAAHADAAGGVPVWPAVAKVSGGITNQLYRVEPPGWTAEGGPPPCEPVGGAALVRVFGASGMIDREVENPTFALLSEHLGPPAYLGRFANGRVEQWLAGHATLTIDAVRDCGTSVKIARQLARLHAFAPAQGLQPVAPDDAEVQLWADLRQRLELASAPGTYEVIAGASESDATLLRDSAEVFDVELLSRAIDALERRAPKDAEVVYCHNDLMPQNLLQDSATGEVRIIDLEYGGPNFAAFDIANHFMEWSGGTDGFAGIPIGHPDFSRIPSRDQQASFCKAYLDERRRVSVLAVESSASTPGDSAEDGGAVVAAAAAPAPPSVDEVDALLAEVSVFASVDNVYWGLWAINQAKAEGTIEFPYLLYARTRLRRGLVDGGFLPDAPPGGVQS